MVVVISLILILSGEMVFFNIPLKRKISALKEEENSLKENIAPAKMFVNQIPGKSLEKRRSFLEERISFYSQRINFKPSSFQPQEILRDCIEKKMLSAEEITPLSVIEEKGCKFQVLNVVFEGELKNIVEFFSKLEEDLPFLVIVRRFKITNTKIRGKVRCSLELEIKI